MQLAEMRTVQRLTPETGGQTEEQRLRVDSARANSTPDAFVFTTGFVVCRTARKQRVAQLAVSSDAGVDILAVPMLVWNTTAAQEILLGHKKNEVKWVSFIPDEGHTANKDNLSKSILLYVCTKLGAVVYQLPQRVTSCNIVACDHLPLPEVETTFSYETLGNFFFPLLYLAVTLAWKTNAAHCHYMHSQLIYRKKKSSQNRQRFLLKQNPIYRFFFF